MRPDMVGVQSAAVVSWRRERLGGPGTRRWGPGPEPEPGHDAAPGSESKERSGGRTGKDQVTEVPEHQQAQVR